MGRVLNLQGTEAVTGDELSTVPAYAGTRSAVYDPARSVYNLKASSVRRIRAAAGAARAGVGLARIAFLGDSLTAGLGSTRGVDDPVTMLRLELARQGYPVGELVVFSSLLDDPRVQYDGGGYHIPYADISAAWPGSVTGTGTVLEIVTNTQSPPFDVSVDGGPATTVTPAGGDQAVQVHTLEGLSAGEHTATITASADWVKVYAAGFRQPSGVVVQNVGISGISSAELFAFQGWQGAGGQLSQPWTLFHPGNVAHDLVVLELGVNDQAEGVSVATYRANMQRLVEWARTRGPDVALVASNAFAGAQSSTWHQYVAALYDVADSHDVPLLDLSDRFGPWDAYNADGATHDLADDGVHLTPAGNAVKARAWLDLIAV